MTGHASPVPAGQASSHPDTLPRVFSFFDASTLVIGSMIGSGIFLKASSVAQKVPHPLAILGLWAICGLLTLAGSLTLAELGAMYPRSGGLYVYLEEAYGPLPAFLYGWSLIAILESGSIAGLAVGVIRTLASQVPMAPQTQQIATVALITLVAGLNLVSSRAGAGVQNLFTVAKSLGLLLLVGGGLLLANGRLEHLSQSGPGGLTAITSGGVAAAMLSILWAYDGWVNATYVTGEVHDAQHTLPRAQVTGTLFVIAAYLAANAAYHFALPIHEIAHASNVARTLSEHLLGPAGAILMTALAMISTAGTLNGSLMTSSRVYFAMAQDGMFFRAVANVHPRFATPHVAIIVQAIWAMLLLTRWQTFDALTDNVVFVYWIFYALGAGAVIVLRARKPDLERPYRSPGYPWVPLAFIAGALFLIISTIASNARESREALYLLGAGLLLYPAFRRQAQKNLASTAAHPQEMTWDAPIS